MSELRDRREAMVREHCERVYSDQQSIMRQLGLAHDSSSVSGRLSVVVSHPVTIGRTLAKNLVRRS